MSMLPAIFLLSLLGVASSEKFLYMEGQVYCDTCRIGFTTRVSEWIAGAKVEIECHDPATKELKLNIEGVTNSTGWYRIPVAGDHEEENCVVKLVESPRKDCDSPNRGADSSRILITYNVGISSNNRLINPLGFAIKDPLPACGDVLKELELA
ncbi:Pollen Ole e 1 allergen/extensin [Cinnamomum micranthum f. kanehirae]|uniref:Pollen Ole e 1 allergen/extensin n=1 Tax=Cinnamomum micranthum f. kanehirae TaxID=337451 RepID=A0A3S3N6K1_9MAGN|nr:Pollen Ole e 1 allergen/extensin [Cinnamomum micranthum f. kanehirae]